MKQISPRWYQLKGYMEAQRALMNRFYLENKKMLSFVREHQWLELQELMNELNDLSCRIEAIENKRHQCYQEALREMGRKTDTPITEILSDLPEQFRTEMRSLKTALALTAERISIENRTLDTYVESRSRTIQEVMGELVPETRGKMYGPTGTLKDTEIGTRSLILDRSL